MHTFNTYTSAKELEKYFNEMNALELYYSEGQEFTGNWVGEGAARLGLSGRVNAKTFRSLCENKHPETGEALTPITRTGRRIAQDHVFGVPKSVSLAYACTGDERIIQAARTAGLKAMMAGQALISTRVRTNGQDFDRKTGNLAASEHIHLTARPVDGFPDPHLHIHYVIFNTTFDPVEKRFKAAQMVDFVNRTVHLDKIFLTALAEELKKLGLDITPTEHAFEISGFSRELIERFSRRTKEIEATAERLGITDPIQKAKLGAMTREGKIKSLLVPELREFWFRGLSEGEKTPLRAVQTLLQRSRATQISSEIAFSAAEAKNERLSQSLGQRQTAKGNQGQISRNRLTLPQPSADKPSVKVTEHDLRAAAFAIKHVFERQSVATLWQLQTEAFNGWSCGLATWEGVAQVLEQAPLLRKNHQGELYTTTAEVLAEENRLINRCLAGKGQHEALNPFWKIEDKRLNDQQRGGVTHILSSRDWIIGLAGKAGVGKTTLMHEVRRGVEAGMWRFIPFAPSSEASRETLRAEGFTNAETVAKLLASERLQAEARGAVWLVDEAGLLSTRQADRLLTLAKELDARLILVGDTGQHHSVERGQAFDLLQKFGNLDLAHVSNIQRQRGQYKEFVELVSEGKIEDAFALLEKHGWIQEMAAVDRKAALAADYIDAIERGKTAVVVAPTHAERNEVTTGIRDALKEKGKLKTGVQWDILRDLSWTEAQKSDFGHYRPGQVVQFNGHVKGFPLGKRVEVIDAKDGVVRVRYDSGFHSHIKPLPLGQAEKFNVYEKDKIEICEGERIRIRTNTRTADGHRVSNGNLYTVNYIDHKGQLVLENGFKLGQDFAHMEYGYTLTSHASQSKSVDYVFVSQTAKYSALASDLAQFYVSVSRGKCGVKIYTDSIELLKENVSVVRERPMANELFREKHEGKGEKRLAEIFAAQPMSAELGKTGEPQLKPEAAQRHQPSVTREEQESEMEMTM